MSTNLYSESALGSMGKIIHISSNTYFLVRGNYSLREETCQHTIYCHLIC